MIANTGVPMRLSNFDTPVVVDLAGAEFAAERLPVIYNHDVDEPLGTTTHRQILGLAESVTVKDRAYHGPAITAAWQFTTEQGLAGRVKEHLDHGFPYQVSIGAQPLEMERVPANGTTQVNGQEYAGPLLVARKSLVKELSVVVFGADRHTETIKAQHEGESMHNTPSHEGPNAQTPVTPGKESPAMTATESPAPAAAVTAPHPPVQASAVTAASAAAAPTPPEPDLQEQARLLGIETVATRIAATGPVGEIELDEGVLFRNIDAAETYAKKNHVSVDAFQKALLEAARRRPVGPIGPTAHTHSAEITSEVIEAAILKSVAGEAHIPLTSTPTQDGSDRYGLEAWYSPQTLEAADAPALKNPSLGSIYALLIRQVFGYNELINARSEEFWSRATDAYNQSRYGGIQAATGSPISLDTVWLNVAKKILLSTSQSVPTTYQQWCKVINVTDFKPVTLVSVDLDGTLAPVGNNGILEHGRMGDSSFTVQTRTFGKMYGITRVERINDDMHAYLSKFVTIGLTVPKTVEQLAYFTLLKHAPTNFTVARGNYLTGADSAFSQEALQKVIAQYDDKVGFDGQPIVSTPDRVIVGTPLKYVAERFYKKENPVLPYQTKNGSEIRYQMMDNEVQGALRPIVSAYLSNPAIKQTIFKDEETVFPNQEPTQYFVSCDPNSPEGAAFYVPCLHGNIAPHVEAYDFGPGMLGTGVQVYADFNIVPGKVELMTRVLGRTE